MTNSKEFSTKTNLYLKVKEGTTVEEAENKLKEILDTLQEKYPEFCYNTSFASKEINEV